MGLRYTVLQHRWIRGKYQYVAYVFDQNIRLASTLPSEHRESAKQRGIDLKDLLVQQFRRLK